MNISCNIPGGFCSSEDFNFLAAICSAKEAPPMGAGGPGAALGLSWTTGGLSGGGPTFLSFFFANCSANDNPPPAEGAELAAGGAGGGGAKPVGGGGGGGGGPFD
jgi:hypothetical protein